jgi:hypothetical protein
MPVPLTAWARPASSAGVGSAKRPRYSICASENTAISAGMPNTLKKPQVRSVKLKATTGSGRRARRTARPAHSSRAPGRVGRLDVRCPSAGRSSCPAAGPSSSAEAMIQLITVGFHLMKVASCSTRVARAEHQHHAQREPVHRRDLLAQHQPGDLQHGRAHGDGGGRVDVPSSRAARKNRAMARSRSALILSSGSPARPSSCSSAGRCRSGRPGTRGPGGRRTARTRFRPAPCRGCRRGSP